MRTPKTINKVIDELAGNLRLTNKKIAEKLSDRADKPIAPQRIGQYRKGPKTPGADFILLWEEVFGDRILDLVKQRETKVSRETKEQEKHTRGVEPAIKEKNLPYNEEREILIRNLDRIGETNEYLLKKIKDLGG